MRLIKVVAMVAVIVVATFLGRQILGAVSGGRLSWLSSPAVTVLALLRLVPEHCDLPLRTLSYARGNQLASRNQDHARWWVSMQRHQTKRPVGGPPRIRFGRAR
jgi:hypothetical protein